MKTEFKLLTVPNFFTLLNLMAGIVSVAFVFERNWLAAGYAILAGAVFDFLDGFAARIFKQNSPIGAQLDSLSDVVTFGVAPSLLVGIYLAERLGNWRMGYTLAEWWTETTPWNNWSGVAALFAFIIAAASALRLAKFNVDDRQTTDFLGLPTPANALFFASMVAGIHLHIFTHFVFEEPIFWITLILLFSLLLLSEIPMFSLKFKHFGWRENESKWILILASLGIILWAREGALALIVFLYLIISTFNWSIRKRLKK